MFPSPCGVRRVRDLNDEDLCIRLMLVSVPLRGKEGAGLKRQNEIEQKLKFPSPCGVRRVRDWGFIFIWE